MVVVQPVLQTVCGRGAGVPAGFVAPGVRSRSGSITPAGVITAPPAVRVAAGGLAAMGGAPGAADELLARLDATAEAVVEAVAAGAATGRLLGVDSEPVCFALWPVKAPMRPSTTIRPRAAPRTAFHVRFGLRRAARSGG